MVQLLQRLDFGHSAVEADLVLLGVGINEVKRTVEDLVGANGCPVAQVARAFDADPGAIRTRRRDVEALVGQQGEWPLHKA